MWVNFTDRMFREQSTPSRVTVAEYKNMYMYSFFKLLLGGYSALETWQLFFLTLAVSSSSSSCWECFIISRRASMQSVTKLNSEQVSLFTEKCLQCFLLYGYMENSAVSSFPWQSSRSSQCATAKFDKNAIFCGFFFWFSFLVLLVVLFLGSELKVYFSLSLANFKSVCVWVRACVHVCVCACVRELLCWIILIFIRWYGKMWTVLGVRG